MSLPIDILPTQRSSIDLSELPKNSFDSVFYGYNLKQVLDDVLLVEFVDESNDGTLIQRRGLFVPINVDSKAWRVGKVILAGPNARLAKVDDYVIFPNNLGVHIANIEIDQYGTLKKGLFLNEARIFGICSVQTNNDESIASNLKTNPTQ